MSYYAHKLCLEVPQLRLFQGAAAMPGNIIWVFLMAGIVANFFSPAGVMLIEQKFAFFCLFMRTLADNRLFNFVDANLFHLKSVSVS